MKTWQNSEHSLHVEALYLLDELDCVGFVGYDGLFCCLFIASMLCLLGHGLPAGLAEVEMIERARAKRAW